MVAKFTSIQARRQEFLRDVWVSWTASATLLFVPYTQDIEVRDDDSI